MTQPSPQAFDLYRQGCVAHAAGDVAGAAALMLEVTAAAPAWADGWLTLGGCLADLRMDAAAADAFSLALTFAPDSAVAWRGYSNALSDLGRLSDAAAAYAEALARELDPTARADLVYRRFGCLAHSGAGAASLDAAAAAMADHWITPFLAPPPPIQTRVSGRPLRVGYLSRWFGLSQIAVTLFPLMRAHDRARVTPVMLSANLIAPPDPSIEGVRLSGDADAIAATIRAQTLDILVFIDGPTSEDVAVLARRPAPIILSWTGDYWHYGCSFPDGVISDAAVWPEAWRLPPFAPALFLPGGVAAYDPAWLPPPATPEPPSRRCGRVTFGSLNRPSKYRPEVAASWARILDRVSGSRLLLRYREFSDANAAAATADLFHAAGIGPDRLTLEGEASAVDWAATFDRVDVMLDPFPFGAGMVAVECFAAGVPMPCRYGDRFMSRLAASIAERLGFAELIAPDLAGAEDLAVALALDPDRLTRLRRDLPRAFHASSLADIPRLARELEALYAGVTAAP